MTRNDKDPTLGNMTNVDWNDPELRSLLAATEALRVDKRGSYGARAVHLRMGAGAGPEGRALLVGETDGVLQMLFDQTLPIGRIVSLNRDPGAALGGTWETCSVLSCRRGARQDDARHAIYVLELQAQRAQERS
ncbi:hypothetical protein [Thiomonas sp. FB-6]|uniref:hypothetical protein n=1 Tax=Thiomonas sp. FB-6 TaxID=1158291 RepID=UPI0003655DCE|nr:hypothetical protein [Thiomonas sp. FB-6]